MKIPLFLFILFFLTGRGIVFAAADTPAPREPTPLEADTFAHLKKKFPGEILTADLNLLHAVVESEVYKKFLAKTHPEPAMPQAFAEIVNASVSIGDDTLYSRLPQKKRYLRYYTELFGAQTPNEVTDAEHFIIHHTVTDVWIHAAVKRGGDTPTYQRTEGPRLSGRGNAQLVRTPQFKEMMKRRFGIEIQGTPNASTAVEMLPVYNFPIQSLTDDLLSADARWIHAMFEKHGTADGLIWIALQDPPLFSRLRYAFTTDKTLLHFVHAEVLKRAREKQKETQHSDPPSSHGK